MRTATNRGICIAGMHRSGTSLLTRVLQGMGLTLGDSDRLMKPRPDNPDGFFEHWDFVRLNDALLGDLGGAWDCPPRLNRGWVSQMEHRKREASALIDRNFDQATGHWGWKDPRNSLTLPFWASVSPGIGCVVSVRNPLMVAKSLERRHGHTILFGIQLWKTYYHAIAKQLDCMPHLVTHYARMLQDPRAEIQRLAGWLELRISSEQENEITSFVRAGNIEQESLEDELTRTGDAELVELYRFLSAKADSPNTRALAATGQRIQAERNSASTYTGWRRRIGESLPFVIDFRQGGNSRAHTIDGWLVPEHRGTWTTLNSARIALRISGPKPTTVRIRVSAQPFLDPGERAREVNVRICGHFAAHWIVEESALYEATLPGDALSPDGNLEIELSASDAATQRDASRAPRLGILIESLEVCDGGPRADTRSASSNKYGMRDFELKELWYARRYEEASETVRRGKFASLWEFHRVRGETELHNPNPLFCTAHYAAVSQFASRKPRWGLVEDYVRYGADRGLSPHWLFSESFYREQVPKLKSAVRAGTITGTYIHYLRIGRHSRLRPHPLFSPWYLENSSRGKPDAVTFEGFVDRGHVEGLRASPLFDGDWYRTQYPDVPDSVEPGAVVESALQHFCMLGAIEGRLPLPDLDINYYAKQCEKNGINGLARRSELLLHFLEHGVRDGLNPNRFFDSSYYLETNPEAIREIAQFGLLGAYEHFLAVGKAKNLRATPALVNIGIG